MLAAVLFLNCFLLSRKLRNKLVTIDTFEFIFKAKRMILPAFNSLNKYLWLSMAIAPEIQWWTRAMAFFLFRSLPANSKLTHWFLWAGVSLPRVSGDVRPLWAPRNRPMGYFLISLVGAMLLSSSLALQKYLIHWKLLFLILCFLCLIKFKSVITDFGDHKIRS